MVGRMNAVILTHRGTYAHELGNAHFRFTEIMPEDALF